MSLEVLLGGERKESETCVYEVEQPNFGSFNFI